MYRLQIYIIAIMLLFSQLLTAQTRKLNENDALKSIADDFVLARNETDTIVRLKKLANIMGGTVFPKHSTSNFIGSFLESGGKFTPYSFYSVGGGLAIHIVGQESKSGDWTRYQLGLEEANPNKIGFIMQSPDRKPVVLPKGTIQSINIQKFLVDDMDELSNKNGMSGSLLIVRNGKILVENYSGFASDRLGKLIDSNTSLNMASGSKMFTAVMIGIAVDQGMLSWDQTVDKIIPQLADRSWASKIKVKHLLSHTSGIGEYWDSKFDSQARNIKSLRDIIPYFIDKPLLFNPSENAIYTNTNFIILGLALESIYNDSYGNLVKKMILDPLEMHNTKYGKPNSEVEYYLPAAPGEWEPISNNSNMGSSSAGGMFSTPQDLLLFAEGLVHNKLIKPVTLKTMTTSHSNIGSGGSYGYGFEITKNSNMSSYGHGGRGIGVRFTFKIYPKTKTVVIMMTNRETSYILDYKLNLETLLNR